MFHFYVSTHWKSNVSRAETLVFNVSFLVSMFHFLFTTPLSKKHTRRKIKPQWERFKTSMGEKSNPNGRNTTETLKSKMKHRMPMFHLLKVLIINTLCYENETWNKKRLKVNIMYARYVRARKERVLTDKQRVLTWGRRVPASAFACQGSMPWQANTIHFLIAELGHRPPTWQCRREDASPPSEDTSPSGDASPAYLYIYAWNKRTYIYAWNNPIYVLQHKT